MYKKRDEWYQIVKTIKIQPVYKPKQRELNTEQQEQLNNHSVEGSFWVYV